MILGLVLFCGVFENNFLYNKVVRSSVGGVDG